MDSNIVDPKFWTTDWLSPSGHLRHSLKAHVCLTIMLTVTTNTFWILTVTKMMVLKKFCSNIFRVEELHKLAWQQGKLLKVLSHTVTDHHVFHISSQFDTDLFRHPLSGTGGKKHPVSICCAKLSFFFPPPDIVFFFLVLCLRSHKLHSSSAPLCVLSHKFLTYGHNLTRSGRPGPVLTCAEVPFGSEGNSLVSLYQPYSPGLCCTRLWRNTHK